MSHIDPQVDPEVLADIRRAAFELRVTDPQEAVRVLSGPFFKPVFMRYESASAPSTE